MLFGLSRKNIIIKHSCCVAAPQITKYCAMDNVTSAVGRVGVLKLKVYLFFLVQYFYDLNSNRLGSVCLVWKILEQKKKKKVNPKYIVFHITPLLHQSGFCFVTGEKGWKVDLCNLQILPSSSLMFSIQSSMKTFTSP